MQERRNGGVRKENVGREKTGRKENKMGNPEEVRDDPRPPRESGSVTQHRQVLRDAMLDQEERLHDLRAAIVAVSLMASALDGIEAADMTGLRFVTRTARELADALHHAWRDAVERLAP